MSPTIGHQPKYNIAADRVEQAVDADIEYACMLGDANFGRRSAFRERLHELDESYVLALETTGLHVVGELAEVLEPGPTDKRGPPRQYHTVPDDVDTETAAEIADELEEEE
ncbi:transposase [Natronorubrum sp. A-ect3]|uniref:transposase n=1 Tax=Natronorubrum sp. A-ect3 TaxID=3242698 RepID=UPI00359ED95D